MGKIALVLEGGALRGIFTAGVIDCFIDNKINFDYVCGVSAGSCNAFAYVAKERGFIKRCMLHKNKGDSFYGTRQMIFSHKYVDLEKVFYDYTEQYGFNYNSFFKSKIKWEFVATNINTGKAEYLFSKDKEEALQMGVASCSLPILTDPIEINGKTYLDGGVADSVPVERAIKKGYKKIVVVCTRKKGSYSKVKDIEKPIFNTMYKEYPQFIKAVDKRTALYKKQITKCEQLEKQGKVILIRPTLPEVRRLESDYDDLNLFYYHGYTKAEEYVDAIKKW